jgi:hypothetical protein
MDDEAKMADYEVFVSYARADGRKYANLICSELKKRKVNSWYDLRNIAPEQDLSVEIERIIRTVQYVLLCLTPTLNEQVDPFVQREITYAQNRQKPIIVLLFPDAQLPERLAHFPQIDFCQKRQTTTLKLIGGMRQLVKTLKTEPAIEQSNPKQDPFQSYLVDLYEQIINYLDTTVYSLIRQVSAADESHRELGGRPLPLNFKRLNADNHSFDRFNTVFDECQKRMVLLGEPGTGKTAALMVYAREAVIARLNDEYQLLPIIAPISTWDSETDLLDWLAWTTDIDVNTLRQQIANKQALLLLDSLEELPADVRDPNNPQGDLRDYRVEFITNLSMMVATPTIITCRSKDYEVVLRKCSEAIAFENAIEIASLNAEQIHTYLHDLPELGILLQTDDHLYKAASTPLFLTLLAFVYNDLGNPLDLHKVSQNTYALWKVIFEVFLERLYAVALLQSGEEISCSLDEVREAMEVAAAYMYMQTWRMYTTTPASVLRSYELAQVPVQPEMLAFTEQLGLIVRDSLSDLGFVSNIIRDSFAFDRLTLYLSSPQAELRLGAARALGLLKDRRASEYLMNALKAERDPYVQYAIKAALDRLQPEYSIFISYRRRDWGTTFLLAEKLENELEAVIFLDRYVDEVDFEASILRHLRSANIFMLIVTDNTFEPRRIHLERDWIRKEIYEALTRSIPCVLVFVDGIASPPEDELPREIRGIVARQGYPLHPTSFEQDVSKLADFITAISPISRKQRAP